MLSDAARFVGQKRFAYTALERLEHRYADHKASKAALFRKGLIASSRDDSIRWYRAYIKAAPRGALVGEARGRIMELHHRQGKLADAQREAKLYMERHPDGPHAKLARSLLKLEP